MNSVVFTSFIVPLFLIACIGVLQSRKVRTLNSYLLADRKTQLFSLVATLVMTEFNTATLISFSSAGLYAHWWALTLPLVFLLGLLFYAFVVAKKWKEFNGISLSHFFRDRYSLQLSKMVSVILFLAMAGFCATYIKSITIIFAPFLPQCSQWVVSAILVLLALFMTLRGGLIAIIRTDIMSFAIILFFLPLLCYYAYQLPTQSTPTFLTLSQMQAGLPPKFVCSLIFLTMFSYIVAPWYGQKVISAHSPKIAMKAVAIAAVIIFILYSLGVLAVRQLSVKGIILTNPEQALPYLVQYALPFSLQGVGYATLFLTTATTLTGVWSAMVTMLLTTSDKRALKFGLGLTTCCALLTYLLANLFVDKILSKMILANIPVVALSFALLAGFYWPKANTKGAYISIITGLIWGFGCYFYYGEENIYTWAWAVYGIPLIFISGLLGSKIEWNWNGVRLILNLLR